MGRRARRVLSVEAAIAVMGVAAAALGTACEAAPPAYQATQAVSVPAHPNCVALVGDVVVVPGLIDSALAILTLEGGELRLRETRALAAGVLALAQGDFDRDGHDDLALSLPAADAITLLLGDGAAGLRDGGTISFPRPGELASGDLDGDGALDLVVSQFSPGTVSVLRGDGAGQFAAPVTRAAGDGLVAPVLADFDGDGDLDVAVAAARQDAVLLLDGDGAGSLAAPRASVPVPSWPSFLESADTDGDGRAEVYGTSNLGDRLFRIVPGPGPTVSTELARAGPIVIRWGSADRLFFVPNKFENTMSVLGPDLVERALLATGDGPTPVALGDLDGDGRTDVVLANGFSNDVVVYLAR